MSISDRELSRRNRCFTCHVVFSDSLLVFSENSAGDSVDSGTMDSATQSTLDRIGLGIQRSFERLRAGSSPRLTVTSGSLRSVASGRSVTP